MLNNYSFKYLFIAQFLSVIKIFSKLSQSIHTAYTCILLIYASYKWYLDSFYYLQGSLKVELITFAKGDRKVSSKQLKKVIRL